VVSAALTFDALGRTFADGTEALRDVTFDVDDGELVAVVGPSGCGKSTLLRIAAGLDAPTTGTVRRADVPLSVVFQDHALMPWRTVRRNVALVAELTGDMEDLDVRVTDAVTRVGLADALDKYPRQLSGGMKMRAALARALVTRPRLVLFDEPFGALDHLTRLQLQRDLDAMRRRERFAGILITHDIEEAVFLADRVVVLGPRPAGIVGEIVVSLPTASDGERDAGIRYDTRFTALCASVARALGVIS
jgi:NitT/TauT family transport system ATP-binding protein